MNAFLFQGSPLDIYIHWIILALGIGILLSLLAVMTSCRSFAVFLNLTRAGRAVRVRLYEAFFRYHPYYWSIFIWLVVLHLMVTIYHLGLPIAGEPYLTAHRVAIFSAVGNVLLVGVLFSSCRLFNKLVGWIVPDGILGRKGYRRFYAYHSYLWWFLILSVGTHVVSGMIHSMHT